MSEFQRRKEAVDLLFDGYFGDRKGAVIALLPQGECDFLSETDKDGEIRPTSVEAKIQLLQFLMAGYLEQYRHYDNQRAKLAGILVAAVAGFSIAPFTLDDATWSVTTAGYGNFQDWLVGLSILALIVISFFGFVASRKHRLRSKEAYNRYKLVLEELNRIIVKEVPIRDIHETGGEKGRKEVAGEGVLGETKSSKRGAENGKPLLMNVTRGFLWNALPWVVIIYALAYGILYFLFRLA